MLESPFSEPQSALDDFRERRELQGLGDSDGLGSDPTLEPPSLVSRRTCPLCGLIVTGRVYGCPREHCPLVSASKQS